MRKTFLTWYDINGNNKPKKDEACLVALEDGSYAIGYYDTGRLFVVEHGDISMAEKPTHWARIPSPFV